MNVLKELEQFAQPVKASSSPAPVALWGQAHPAEMLWIHESTFDFAVKMRDVLKQWGGLTPGQLAAVQKCMAYAAPKPAYLPNAVSQGVDPGSLDLSKIPSGMYAVPDGNTRLKVCIAKPHQGKWAGWIFVSDGATYGQNQRYGAQKPDGRYQGQIRSQLALIAHDPAAASAAYGKLTGRCGICGRPLENEESVARGIGPVCAGRLGW